MTFFWHSPAKELVVDDPYGGMVPVDIGAAHSGSTRFPRDDTSGLAAGSRGV